MVRLFLLVALVVAVPVGARPAIVGTWVVKGDGFAGSGSARFYDGERRLVEGPFATTLTGTRVVVE